MPDLIEVILGVERFDAYAFRCVPDKAICGAFQFLFGQRLPIRAGLLRHWLILHPIRFSLPQSFETPSSIAHQDEEEST